MQFEGFLQAQVQHIVVVAALRVGGQLTEKAFYACLSPYSNELFGILNNNIVKARSLNNLCEVGYG